MPPLEHLLHIAGLDDAFEVEFFSARALLKVHLECDGFIAVRIAEKPNYSFSRLLPVRLSRSTRLLTRICYVTMALANQMVTFMFSLLLYVGVLPIIMMRWGTSCGLGRGRLLHFK